MPNNKAVDSFKFIVSLLIISIFLLVMVNADKFYKGTDPIFVDNSFVQVQHEKNMNINIDMMYFDEDGKERGVLQYIVQPGDSLSKIASMFGTTVSHIQEINDLKSGVPIRPKQELIITDEEKGFLYTIEEKTNIVVFANKYNLDVKELMTLNYIQDETELLQEGQELFINVSQEKSYKLGLQEKPKVQYVPKVTKVSYKPVVTKTSQKKKTTVSTSTSNTTSNRSSSSGGGKSNIIRKWTFTKSISNRFYAGHCTRYAAISTPEIFPYESENKQVRPFGGNANQRYANAKNAGFDVGQTPRVGAIIVYQNGRRWAYAGHVGKVVAYYPSEGKLIIRDMNRAGKFIVTERREKTSNSNIKGYIYPPKEPWQPPQS